MLVTNTSKSTRGFHDKSGKPVMLAPGEGRNVDIDAGTQALLKRMGDDYRLGGTAEQEQKHVPYVREEEPAAIQPRRGRPKKNEA